MKLLTAKEAAQYLRVSLFTLRTMEKEGLLVPFRTPGGHRRYSQEMLNEYLERSRHRSAGEAKRILVVDDGAELLHLLAHTFSSCRFSRADDPLGVGIKLAQFKPHMVVVNTGMSGLDASDLCQRLDGQAGEFMVLPFQAPQETRMGAAKAGSDPSRLGALQETIKRLLALPP